MDTMPAQVGGVRPAPASELEERLGLPEWVVAVEAIARGSRRELWRGRDRRRGVDVVIKVVPPGRRTQLEAEARALARLGGHPHVVTLSAVGAAPDGTGWMATDLAAGGNLAAYPLTCTAQCLRLASQLSGALAHAHERGVVHGDVTPANVLLDAHGDVQLTDFGAAALADGTARCLRSGHTPRFAAPERRRGGPPTGAADLYGFGASVSEILPSGTAGVPRRIRRLLERCTDARPGRRPSAQAAADRLAGWG